MNNEIAVWVKASDADITETKRVFVRNIETKHGGMVYPSELVKEGNLQNVEVLLPLPNHVAISVERLEALISLAEDGYKLHVKNACHSEFLQEDREDISAAKQALKSITK